MRDDNAILFIHGAGGHAKSISDATNFQSLYFVDPFISPDKTFSNGKLIQTLPLPQDHHFHIVGIGDNQKRAILFNQLQNQDLFIVKILAPSAIVSKHAVISPGCFIAQNAYVGIDTHIKENCIINTGAIIEHDVFIGEHTHISINACIAGNANISAFCFIGAGAIVIDGIQITDHVIVGAGATVVHNITESGTYVGTPAKKIK